jgi:hypothetical protein
MANIKAVNEEIVSLINKKYWIERDSYMPFLGKGLSEKEEIRAIENGLGSVRPQLEEIDKRIVALRESVGRLNATTREGKPATPEFNSATGGYILAGWRVQDGDVNRRATRQEAGYLFSRFGGEANSRKNLGFSI